MVADPQLLREPRHSPSSDPLIEFGPERLLEVLLSVGWRCLSQMGTVPLPRGTELISHSRHSSIAIGRSMQTVAHGQAIFSSMTSGSAS
jgi:hypothetical protein